MGRSGCAVPNIGLHVHRAAIERSMRWNDHLACSCRSRVHLVGVDAIEAVCVRLVKAGCAAVKVSMHCCSLCDAFISRLSSH